MTTTPSDPTIVSLFSGYGGLDLGVQAVLGGRVIAHVEFDKAPSKILKHHWPDVPNLGDITAVDWKTIGQKVNVLTGGFPCQDVSLAGLRRGLKTGTRSGLWAEFARAIDGLRPELVVIENVRGLLSAEAHSDLESDPWALGDGPSRPTLRALGAVLGDLADLGYDAEWRGVLASDAGAPHARFRVFVFAYPASKSGRVGYGNHVPVGSRTEQRESNSGRGSFPHAACDSVEGRRQTWRRVPELADDRRGEVAPDPERVGIERRGDTGEVPRTEGPGEGGDRSEQRDPALDRAATPPDADGAGFRGLRGLETVQPDAHGRDSSRGPWGAYESAIRRWERITGHEAPSPTEPAVRNGARRLSPAFVEWMMGLQPGHVTGAGITRTEQLKALGNGVVPQQAALAVRDFLS